jgi:hypothetical protein
VRNSNGGVCAAGNHGTQDDRSTAKLRMLNRCSLARFAEDTAEKRENPQTLDGFGGPGRVRTDDGISPVDYESTACNQHGVRPNEEGVNKKARSGERPGLVRRQADILHESRPAWRVHIHSMRN